MADQATLANIARMRWRADLHRLNGDEAGAALNESTADLEERYAAAKDAWIDDPTDDLVAHTYHSLLAQLREERRYWRTVRAAFTADKPETMDNFTEPSDDELLGGAA